MMKKKFITLLAAGALVTNIGAISSFAAARTANPPVCTISNCTETGDHHHNGTTYAAHFADDGHTYHSGCGVSGCTISGNHTHHSGGSHHGHRSGGHHR